MICDATTSKQGPIKTRISGKNLGDLNHPEFCPRCFWLKIKMRNRFPYSIFPGIFSSIDSFTKRSIHAYIEAEAYESLPVYQFIVEAESEEEAIRKVQSGEYQEKEEIGTAQFDQLFIDDESIRVLSVE